MNDGTDQSQRLPPALAERLFGVDEQDFAQRVAMSAALARHLRFVSLSGHDKGDWSRFFDSDESLVLARIASFDLDAMQRALVRDLEVATLAHLADQTAGHARLLDGWWIALASGEQPAARAVREHIEQSIEQRLRDDLAWVDARFGPRIARDTSTEGFAGLLSPLWRVASPMRPASAASDREALRTIGFAFLGAIGRLKSLAAQRLADSLESGLHEPAVALFIAFLKVYGSVQDDINRFARRHVEFYYRDCLGMREAPGEPDSLHLVCRREARAEPEFLLPGDTAFDAGKDAAGQLVEYRGDAPLVVTEAAVAALCTLRVDRDPLIAPERDFGFATRIKVARLPVDAQGPDRAAGERCHALFGGGRGASETTHDAQLGLAIATPVLHLAEGEREVRVLLRMGGEAGDAPLARLVDELALAPDIDAFRQRLGPLFARWLVVGEPLAHADLARLRAAAIRHLGPPPRRDLAAGDPLYLLQGQDAPSRELFFSRLVNGMFELRLTAAKGWWTPAAPDVVPAAEGGLLLVIRLRREDPAIVGCDPEAHGAQWPTPLPVLRLDLSSQGRLYGYSLLAPLQLRGATVTVKVRGVKDIVLRNDLGRLDPSKAFLPFGPMPTRSSYMVFGAPEIARKHLLALTVLLEWRNLPTGPGGFASWYRGYAPTYRGGDPVATLAILQDGQWRDGTGPALQVPLFDVSAFDGHLEPQRALAFDTGAIRKYGRAASAQALDGPHVRGGLFRLQLSGPEGAFGHAAYPLVLSESVSAQARRRRPAPRPNPPYTPLAESLCLDYEATDDIDLDRLEPDAAPDGPSRLFHIYPFGLKALKPTPVGSTHGLLPRLDHDGNLYIGIAAPSLRGTLTLLFHLRAADAADPAGGPAMPGTHWAWLQGDVWRPLAPSRVLSDSTAGFLATGIVTLDLPPDLDADNEVMPRGLFWLRLSADHGFERFAGLYAVRAQALRITRVLPAGALPPGSAGGRAVVGPIEPRRSIAGLARVEPVGSPLGGRAAQDGRRLHTDAGERLQHKQRASLPWDFERLVLSRFSNVAKVKCFAAHEVAQAHGGAPGRVLVAVVPDVARNVTALAASAPRLATSELAEIQAWLCAHASPWTQVRVRNVSYDRIQVRCTLQCQRDAHVGFVLRRVERAIVDYLSPWQDGGLPPRFGWTLRCEDVQAHLRGLEGVAAVTQLSLLQVACDDDGTYTLGDTARMAGRGHDRLDPHRPWSLALPMPEHLITVAEAAVDPAPLTSGIRELAVGRTLIVGGDAP